MPKLQQSLDIGRNAVIFLKCEQWYCIEKMPPKDADKMSVGAVWSLSTLFARSCLSKYLRIITVEKLIPIIRIVPFCFQVMS